MNLRFFGLLVALPLSTAAAESGEPAAPAVDRVGFPSEYATDFQVLRTFFRTNDQKVITIFGNDLAGSVTNADQRPYPYGSVIVMETARTLTLANGEVQKGHVTGLHAMRKERGFGAAYEGKQAGEWEFVEYAGDGQYLTPPGKSARCADCHLKAGAAKDFVYGGRFGEDTTLMRGKAVYFERDLHQKHWLDGLYVSIVPASPPGHVVPHTVDQPGNVIHAGVWTGRYLAGVGYQYAVTQDVKVRQYGGEILQALRILQEVTGKPGLLARGYVKGHGPVEDWERDGKDSPEWHQGQGRYAEYRWHGDVSVDNFNAVLYGYAIYYDLAADEAQRQMISQDVDRLMTHLLDNHCRIIDVDGEVTLWGHVGVDPDPQFDEYYRKLYATRFNRGESQDRTWRPPLRGSLMLLPDLLIAQHITGNNRYGEFYRQVLARFKDNPDRRRNSGPFSLERLARVNHSSEGQAYEALYNLIRFEKDPDLLGVYRKWVEDLWEMNWMEGNPLFTWMTLVLLPEYRAPLKPGVAPTKPDEIAHGQDAAALALQTLRLFPVDRVLRPVMNSWRPDIERNPFARSEALSARPIPIDQRPLDNEYAWKGNPYQLDGWLKPAVTGFQESCDDPQVEWCSDSAGRLFLTRDGGLSWQDVTSGLRGARVEKIAASRQRTLVLHAQTDQGLFMTRDGGLSWRPAGEENSIVFPSSANSQWSKVSEQLSCRLNPDGELMVSHDAGSSAQVSMNGWRIPKATSLFVTSHGLRAGGPGGFYRSGDGVHWHELKIWPEFETGAADYLHAYWMGRYYGFVSANE
jgi:hypothetical protein